ncbi:GSCFA domain-containing protein [Epibacterium ulvae]|uniref:GSCFA domain-containing protein n=1 Tax=Epibacterium ulvae TaxID=1156985 RepID=UPI001BFC5601|nr:GSCFA domain-containing protein [Epibacterium ulvae]MBT8154525.1 GSCFA domain-containing protein [Epibacterium ulvae]
MTPYRKQKRKHFWRTAAAKDTARALSTFYTPKFKIAKSTKVAAAGSCFAQNIRRHLIQNGYQFVDFETAPPFFPEVERKSFGYELFSARFGNIYTLEQLHQLALRSFGQFETSEPFWEKDSRFFDPLRSTIEPNGFASIEDAQAARASHLRRVREMFLHADVLIFTLGLTETWISQEDGTVFPLCPGVNAGVFDDEKYAFSNTGFSENLESFCTLRRFLKSQNPDLKFILTVSPVPLEATATAHNVICATSYSKSVLRAVAGTVCDQFPDVDYFPSYEIFTSPLFKGQFYQDNMRDPSPDGIAAAMDLFFSAHQADQKTVPAPHITPPAPNTAAAAKEAADRFAAEQQTICDEMLLGNENREL